MRSTRKTVLFMFLACLLFTGTACASINVIVTISPLGRFVREVGGDKVHVTVMIPPGAEPHTYEPTPRQMRRVSHAELYVKLGTGIEFERTWLPGIVSANRDMVLLDASRGIELIKGNGHSQDHGHHAHGGRDPHVWLSPANAVKMVMNIAEGLAELDERNAHIYEENAATYIARLEELDRYIKDRLSVMDTRKFVVLHPAWGYYAERYALEQIPIEHEGKTPAPRTLARMIDKTREHGIGTVIVSPQFSAKSAEVLAESIGARVLTADPLAEDYIGELERITDIIAGGP